MDPQGNAKIFDTTGKTRSSYVQLGRKVYVTSPTVNYFRSYTDW